MIKNCVSAIIGSMMVLFLQAQGVTITPEFPERGETVTVTYDNAQATSVTLNFPYSNFYDVPYVIKLEKKGNLWTTSFKLARYATFAAFYLQSGDAVVKPAKDKLYEVWVYEKKKPVFNAYLYRGYSMSAQMGKSPALSDSQALCYERELQLYPDNYEAKLRLLTLRMNKEGAGKENIKKEAMDVIAAKFNSDPTNGGNLNKVTMGYLMIGENGRVDSIRKVVVEKYPTSSLAWDYYTGLVAKEKSKEEQVVLFEKALQHKTAANASSFEGMHQRLFEIYAETKNARALYHARYMTGDQEDPYRPMAFKKIAQTLLDNNLALDTAAWYASRALSMADSFPVGVIRYFPETGYIYPYTSDSLRQSVYGKARGNMLSILGLINFKRGRVADANANMDQAIRFSMDKETVDNAALFFRRTKQTARLQELQSVRMELMAKEVAKKRIKVPAPSLRYFTTLDGKPVDTMALKNKIIVIDFWATWCVPCMEEMPYLQKLYDAYKSDVVFMVVNSGARNTLADAQKWNGNKKYTFPVYYNTDPAVGEKFKFSVIPATYVIGRDGNINFSNIGFEGPDIEMKLKLQIEMASGL